MTDAAKGLRFYVLRHGEPARRDLFYGHYDIDLSPRGLEQAQAQAQRLGRIPFTAIYSSDLRRAHRGAQLVSERCGVPVTIDPDLREMCLGALEAMPHAEAMQRYPQWAGRSYLDMLDARMPDGGESVRDCSTRVFASIERIAAAHAGSRVHGRWPTVLVYVHNTVARVLLARAAGAGVAGYTRFVQRYGAINRLDVPVVGSSAEREPGDSIDWERAAIGYANRDPLASVEGER